MTPMVSMLMATVGVVRLIRNDRSRTFDFGIKRVILKLRKTLVFTFLTVSSLTLMPSLVVEASGAGVSCKKIGLTRGLLPISWYVKELVRA